MTLKLKKDYVAILAVIAVAAVIAGEYCTYDHDISRGSAVAWGSGSASYTVTSDGSDAFDAVMVDNGETAPVDTLYIYRDSTYDDYYDDACSMSQGLKPYSIDQDYDTDQFGKYLAYRGFGNVEFIGEEGLLAITEDTANASGIGILVMSYALPGSVYGASDKLLDWVHAGGSLYWWGSEIGRFYVASDGLHEANGQMLFFGTEGAVNVSEDDLTADGKVSGFTDALSLKNSHLGFALDISSMSGIQLGFSKGAYASVSMVSCGGGQVIVFSGDFSKDTFDDPAQVIASHLTCSSKLVDYDEGKVVRGNVSGTFEFVPSSHMGVYIYMGGTYQYYGAWHSG